MKKLQHEAYYWTLEGWIGVSSRAEAWEQAVKYASDTGIVTHYPVVYYAPGAGQHITDGKSLAVVVEELTGKNLHPTQKNVIDGQALLSALGSKKQLQWGHTLVDDAQHDHPQHRLASK